jgi:hypothetical protein
MSSLFQSKDDGCLPALSYTQRWYGFVGCFCMGALMSILSSFALIKGDITSFAIFYSCGNIIALASTGFVWGPKKQLKKMFHKSRAIATTIYLVLLLATLIVACADLGMTDSARTGVCIVMIIIQFIALCWYCLSYIPYARTMVKNCLGIKG